MKARRRLRILVLRLQLFALNTSFPRESYFPTYALLVRLELRSHRFGYIGKCSGLDLGMDICMVRLAIVYIAGSGDVAVGR